MHATLPLEDHAVTVAQAIAGARGAIPASEARLLLRRMLGCSHAQLAAYPERLLEGDQVRRFRSLVARRALGEPVAYIVGEREFYGRRFRVTPAVLIPRPETELLVEVALAKIGVRSRLRILDLGTGSGVLAITLALELPGCELTAVEASPAAIEVARANALCLGAPVRFVLSDWYGALSGERFDLILANPPYVAVADPHLAQGDLRFEPRTALTDGSGDGLASIRAIVAGAPRHLRPGGWLLLEHGCDQARACHAVLMTSGLRNLDGWRDLGGSMRVAAGAWCEPGAPAVDRRAAGG